MSHSIYKLNDVPVRDSQLVNLIESLSPLAFSGNYNDLDCQYPYATNTDIGGVYIGDNLFITRDGVLSTENCNYTLSQPDKLTKKYRQIIDVVDGDVLLLPDMDDEEADIVEIHVIFKVDNSNINLTFPNIKWAQSPQIKTNAVHEYIFTYNKYFKEWVGGYIIYSKPDDEMNIIEIPVETLKANNYKIYLFNTTRGDDTLWTGYTDWGDGTYTSETHHQYDENINYPVIIKTKYSFTPSLTYATLEDSVQDYSIILLLYKYFNHDINAIKNYIGEDIDEDLFYCMLNTFNVKYHHINKNITDYSTFFLLNQNKENIELIENLDIQKMDKYIGLLYNSVLDSYLDLSKWNTRNKNVGDLLCGSICKLNISNFIIDDSSSNILYKFTLFDDNDIVGLDKLDIQTDNITIFNELTIIRNNEIDLSYLGNMENIKYLKLFRNIYDYSERIDMSRIVINISNLKISDTSEILYGDLDISKNKFIYNNVNQNVLNCIQEYERNYLICGNVNPPS